MLDLHAVRLRIPENANIVLGQSHFIKTVEDVYEAMVNSAPQVRFVTRGDGNDAELQQAALEIATSVGAGHFFAVVMRDAFPINTLKAIQSTPEACNIYCATANPVEVIVAETEQGRGVLGVIDGSSPKGVETAENVSQRHGFLRKIGYKR